MIEGVQVLKPPRKREHFFSVRLGRHDPGYVWMTCQAIGLRPVLVQRVVRYLGVHTRTTLQIHALLKREEIKPGEAPSFCPIELYNKLVNAGILPSEIDYAAGQELNAEVALKIAAMRKAAIRGELN